MTFNSQNAYEIIGNQNVFI